MRQRFKSFDGVADATSGAGAFSDFFTQQSPALKRYLTRFVGATDAEDLAQEAFARVYAEERSKIRSIPRFLFQTARNLALNHLRRRKLTATDDIAAVETSRWRDEAPTAEEALALCEQIACVRAAIETLPPRRREIFLLRMRGELPYAEIARRTGISLKSVESHLARGLEACQDFFDRCERQGCSGKCRQGGIR